jgi:hypothetical protein
MKLEDCNALLKRYLMQDRLAGDWLIDHPLVMWGAILCIGGIPVGLASAFISVFITADLERITEEQKQAVFNTLITLAIFITYEGIVIFVVGLVMAASDIILKVLSTPWSIGPVLLLAGVLYWFRGNIPFAYGINEMFVGTLATTLSIINTVSDLATKSLGVMGGLYIICVYLIIWTRGFHRAVEIPDRRPH